MAIYNVYLVTPYRHLPFPIDYSPDSRDAGKMVPASRQKESQLGLPTGSRTVRECNPSTR